MKSISYEMHTQAMFYSQMMLKSNWQTKIHMLMLMYLIYRFTGQEAAQIIILLLFLHGIPLMLHSFQM